MRKMNMKKKKQKQNAFDEKQIENSIERKI